MTLVVKDSALHSQPINRGCNTAFRANRLSLGLVVPIENHATSPVPTTQNHVERVQFAEAHKFSAAQL